jgi:ABC-type multidrug transport system fused ATPase/permease subunit
MNIFSEYSIYTYIYIPTLPTPPLFPLRRKAFVIVPNVVLASKMFGNFMREITKEVQKALADSTAASEEALGSMRTVKSLHAQEEMSKRYGKHMEE